MRCAGSFLTAGAPGVAALFIGAGRCGLEGIPRAAGRKSRRLRRLTEAARPRAAPPSSRLTEPRPLALTVPRSEARARRARPLQPIAEVVMLLSEAAKHVPWGIIWGAFAGFWVVVLAALFVFVPLMGRWRRSDAHHPHHH